MMPRARAADRAAANEREVVTMKEINRGELVDLLTNGSIVLIEALPELHYNAEHIAGAVNLPGQLTAEFAARVAPGQQTTVVTYCSGLSCTRSKAAAIAFEKLGYSDVRVYTGGKADWYDAGLPLESVEAAPAA